MDNLAKDEVVETDLVAISERDVIEKGRHWLKLWRKLGTANATEWDSLRRACSDAKAETLGALVLLEQREREKAKIEKQ